VNISPLLFFIKNLKMQTVCFISLHFKLYFKKWIDFQIFGKILKIFKFNPIIFPNRHSLNLELSGKNIKKIKFQSIIQIKT